MVGRRFRDVRSRRCSIRISGTRRKISEPSGLGLCIAAQIVNAHGGKLDVTSTERGGTTFRVQLPRRPASKPPSDVRAEKPGRSSG
ncbi:MAG: ATP-binding protein [Polyangiales bacterium]